MDIRGAYRRLATGTEGRGIVVGLALNTLLTGGAAINALQSQDYAAAAGYGAATVALGAVSVDMAMRFDSGTGLPQHMSHLLSHHNQPNAQ